ncbi:pyridoxine 5'-phosphate synthase [Empedobacter stercoris]|uniref:Pyridoxine 5'-phosphate synthase n=2 Tax=Empedobacter TaxID=59734 RepID=A0ABY8V4S2_9FLAO|nr:MULTISPECIES: pyridoxine 5'-phosphate synthase [Empedobacter]MCA4776922.1 pyridoxine 5'-phosphate synthase [Empedobacter stercoris]MDM1522592.1 pyridoxine 5'-phosphate synthase [Empedobacter sp. 225-1]MDM1543374.1 pyridoxine 5'-phosphate synthase [Empedobacter sp. 189-2]NOJ76058.1 pyridoxine 5'-phosphate synthase [Empedobacter stercoris]UWX66482.1 pyridoxine 5'-phosphate synthase [Empedobacter stercoris]
MTKLSVNINKIATIRNARGGNTPNLVEAAIKIQEFGGQGITIHPRPDERHIRYQDVYDLKPVITTEFNIEGKPIDSFMELVLNSKPEQVTLVPDAEDAITSNAGWDTIKHFDYLTDVIKTFKDAGIRTSIFLDPNPALIESAAKTGADRIELYTEEFATQYGLGNLEAINPYKETAKLAIENGLAVNAGHDLSLDNIEFFIREIPQISEVSIGHALISEALYLGLENTIQAYLRKIEVANL